MVVGGSNVNFVAGIFGNIYFHGFVAETIVSVCGDCCFLHMSASKDREGEQTTQQYGGAQKKGFQVFTKNVCQHQARRKALWVDN